MDEKLNRYRQQVADFIERLHDVRFAGQVVFAIIVLLIFYSGVRAIQTNYELQKQVASLKQQVNVEKLQNNNLKLQNEYYNSNQFLELSARQNFGLAAPGETELIIPKNVALAHVSAAPKPATRNKAKAKQPAYQRNFESWVNFFLHRQT